MDLAEVLETRYILIVCNKHKDQSWGAAFGFNTFLPPLLLAGTCCEVSGDVGDRAPQINQIRALAGVLVTCTPCISPMPGMGFYPACPTCATVAAGGECLTLRPCAEK